VSTNQYPGTLKLDIYNSAGEFVKSLEDGRQLTGPYQNTYSWTGTNWKGDNVADGVYLFILSEPFGVKRARLVLVR
jgi:flagellar hook assembly protein FlgD